MPRPVILVVEDHRETRQVYAELFGVSYTVLQAGDGSEALAVIQEHRPALVITDFSLPGMDGFELIRRIRSTPATQDVPTICLSGRRRPRAKHAPGKWGAIRSWRSPALLTCSSASPKKSFGMAAELIDRVADRSTGRGSDGSQLFQRSRIHGSSRLFNGTRIHGSSDSLTGRGLKRSVWAASRLRVRYPCDPRPVVEFDIRCDPRPV
jgi:CheY-like chemotaxis protein